MSYILLQPWNCHAYLQQSKTSSDYYAPAHREGDIKRCFCPSVRPSVAYIANNSRTQRPIACPNLAGRFPTFDAIRIPISRSKGQGHQAH